MTGMDRIRSLSFGQPKTARAIVHFFPITGLRESKDGCFGGMEAIDLDQVLFVPEEKARESLALRHRIGKQACSIYYHVIDYPFRAPPRYRTFASLVSCYRKQ